MLNDKDINAIMIALWYGNYTKPVDNVSSYPDGTIVIAFEDGSKIKLEGEYL